MADKKTIIEEALLDVQNIQNALNANTKEILRSVAREEIDSVVKESLKEEMYQEEDLNQEEDDATDNLGVDADAATASIGGDEENGEESEGGLEDIQGSEEVGTEMEPEDGMDALASDGEELDMTAASDDDVIAIYKKMSGEDEIEIVGDEIHLSISEPGQYIVKTNDKTAPTPEMGVEPEISGDDDVDYEIEIGDDEDSEEEPSDLTSVDDEENGEGETEEGGEEKELDESIPVGTAQAHRLPGKTNIGQPLGAGADNLKESKNANLVLETTKKYNALLTEAKKLKSENEEFRKALKLFRTQLSETVVFNSNLTYVTMLLSEHTVTKGEKQSIIKRFDEVNNLKDSKRLYKTIVSELENRKPISESVENKITKGVSSSTSKQLNESTAYVDPSTKRIIDLMKRVEGR